MHLLLVDDDIDDQEIFISALQAVSNDIGYTLASSAIDAQQLLSSGSIIPSIIFLDLNMPVTNGKEYLKQLKADKDFATIPVIIYSTTSDAQSKKEAMDAGAEMFITKPEKFSELVRILKVVLAA